MVKTNMTALGVLLRRYREERGLTQEGVAERAGPGLSVNTIGNIERGRTQPYEHTVEAICHALNLDTEERAAVLAAQTIRSQEEIPLPSPASREADLPLWIPVTKFSPLAPRHDVVLRARLLEAVHKGLLGHRVLLLSSPAGSGKTTLLVSALHDASFPHAWVALDEDDNDPARFLALLIAAVRRLGIETADDVQKLLASLPNPSAHIQQIVSALINAVAMLPGRAVLVLDDVHVLTDPAIFVALDRLIDRLPPQLHLVLATRHDPALALARLRARGELAEIRFPDLRFLPQETTLLLNMQHDLSLAPGELAMVQQRTDGWAAGLRLVVTALDRRASAAERDALLATLTRAERQMFEFLTEEVLRHEGEDVRRFLLESSILSRLTPSLCRHVTGFPDAAALLADLEHRNLFIDALDDAVEDEPAFRYHDLFAAFLYEQLRRAMPERVAELHRRAAEASAVPAEVINHYLQGGWWQEAADKIESVAPGLLEQGLMQTVQGWIEQLPASFHQSRPMLQFLLGLCAFRQDRIPEARVTLEQAARGFGQQGQLEAQGKVLTYLVTVAFLQGDLQGTYTLTDQALAMPLDDVQRVRALLLRARVSLLIGRPWSAVEDFEAAMQVAEAAGRQVLVALVAAIEPTVYVTVKGGTERVERALKQVAGVVEQEPGPVLTTIEAQRTILYFWRGRVDDALVSAERWLDRRQRYGSENPLLDLFPLGGMAGIAAVRGEYDRAYHYLDLMAQQYQAHGTVDRLPAGGFYLCGRFYLFEERHAEAREVYRQLRAVLEVGVTIALKEQLHGLLSWSEGRSSEAETIFHRAIELQRQIPASILYGDARLLLAQLYFGVGQFRGALDELVPVLEEDESEEVLGPFLWEGPPLIPLLQYALSEGIRVNFIRRLLALLGAAEPAQPTIMTTGERLSPREVDILRLLVAGAANRDIAERLIIGESTVKTHVSHILRKLDVSSRMEAVARAHDLHLV